MEIREVLAVNLRKLRRAKGLSQEELAHRAKIDRTYISSLERSVYAAGIDVVDRLARVLGVEAADLLRRPSSPGDKKRGRSRIWRLTVRACEKSESAFREPGRRPGEPRARKTRPPPIRKAGPAENRKTCQP